MVICAAYGCNSRSGRQKVSFFRFPTDKQLKKVWVEKIGRGNGSKGGLFEPKRHHRLCSLHFEESEIERSTSVNFLTKIGFKSQNLPRLKDNAMPTIFLHKTTKPARMSAASIESKRRKIEIVQSCSSHSEHPTDHVESMTLDLEGPLIATPLYDMGDLNTLASVAADQSQVTYSTSFSVQSQTPKWACNVKSTQTHTSVTDMSTQTDWENDVPSEAVQLPELTSFDACDISELSVLSGRHDIIDESWVPDSDSEEISVGDQSVECVNSNSNRKFIVYESQLDKLLHKCELCSTVINIKKHVKGAELTCSMYCAKCDAASSWCSMPGSGSLPVGHLELAAAIMFSGSSPYQFLRALEFAGITVFKPGAYFNIQKHYLCPAISEVWNTSQKEHIQQIVSGGVGIKLGGDARCCSPGHTAKFGSYSMMNLENGRILDIQLVQSNEVKNSYAMELEGLQRSLAFLTLQNVEITHLVTDRHSSVKKYMRIQHPDIIHWFDVWHVAKGVFKKLEAAGKKKGCEKVHAWARSVSNHLYWCAASSNGDGELVQQKWLSILNHVTDVHEGHGDRFPRCEHGEIGDRKWMKKGYKPHAELSKVVKGRLLVNDVKKLSPAEQTSSLEAFHKVICSFVPKSLHFNHANMEARLFLAALHFNENCNRKQGVTKDGRPQYSVSYPKARKGEPIAKEIKTEQTFGYVTDLMDTVLGLREFRPSYSTAKMHLLSEDRERPLPLCQSTPRRMTKQQVVDAHVSRFNDNSQ